MKKFITLIIAIFTFVSASYGAAWQVQEAREHYKKGQYNEALSSVNAAINSETKSDIDVYFLRAEIYTKLNQKDNAIKDLKYIDNQTRNQGVILGQKLGDAYLKLNKYEDAMTYYMVGYVLNIKRNRYAVDDYLDSLSIDMMKIINDKTIPLRFRLAALVFLRGAYGETYQNEKGGDYKAFEKYGITVLKLSLTAIKMVANTNPQDELFMETSQQQLIDNIKKSVKEFLNNDLAYEVFDGYAEYVLGNQETGLKIVKGALEESRIRGGFTTIQTIDKELKNYLEIYTGYSKVDDKIQSAGDKAGKVYKNVKKYKSGLMNIINTGLQY